MRNETGKKTSGHVGKLSAPAARTKRCGNRRNCNAPGKLSGRRWRTRWRRVGSSVSCRIGDALPIRRSRLLALAEMVPGLALTRSMVREYAQKDILVNAVALEAVNTRMVTDIDREAVESYVQSVLLRRLAEPVEVARVFSIGVFHDTVHYGSHDRHQRWGTDDTGRRWSDEDHLNACLGNSPTLVLGGVGIGDNHIHRVDTTHFKVARSAKLG